MSHLRLSTIVMVFLWLTAPISSDAQNRTKIVVGYASMSSVVTTLWVAQEKGFFSKNGLDVQSIFIPGSPTLIATLNTGEVHIGYTGGTATLGAAVGGLDLKIVASFGNFVQTDLVVRPEIKTPSELKGKRIGVTSIGGTGWMSAMLGLEQIGLNPERDGISLAAFGDQRVITQALESGTIQGASISGIFSRKLKRAGFNFLGDLEKIPLVGTSIVVKSDYLASHQATVRSALRALMEGHGYVLNPANKSAVIEVITKKLGITDPVAASDGYDDYVRRTDKKGFVVLDGLKNIQRFMKLRNAKIGDINLERMIDESIMRELEKSGFLEQAMSGKFTVR